MNENGSDLHIVAIVVHTTATKGNLGPMMLRRSLPFVGLELGGQLLVLRMKRQRRVSSCRQLMESPTALSNSNLVECSGKSA